MLPLSEKTEINALQQISRHIVTGLKDGNKVMPLPRQASFTKTRPNNTTRFLKQAAYYQYIVLQPIVLKLNQKPQKPKGS